MNALFIAPASSSISGVSMNPGAIVLTRIGRRLRGRETHTGAPAKDYDNFRFERHG